MQTESGDDVIYDPSRLRGISALAMPSQDLKITPYNSPYWIQPKLLVVGPPHLCAAKGPWCGEGRIIPCMILRTNSKSQVDTSEYVATEAKSNISFHQISRSTGERVRHQKVLESAAESRTQTPGAVVEKDELVKGYEYSKGQYVIIEPTELDNLRVPSKHTIAVSQFIDQNELNPEYVEKPYFVVPENDAQAEAFAVVRQALVKSGKVAIGKIAFSGREHVFAWME